MQEMEGVQPAQGEEGNLGDMNMVHPANGEAQEEESDFENTSMMPDVGAAQGGLQARQGVLSEHHRDWQKSADGRCQCRTTPTRRCVDNVEAPLGWEACESGRQAPDTSGCSTPAPS